MEKKVLIIRNPVSGTFRNKLRFNKIVRTFKRKKYDLEIRTTKASKGADEIIREENFPYDFVCVCGGDGTLNQVITGFSNSPEKRCPIYYVSTRYNK